MKQLLSYTFFAAAILFLTGCKKTYDDYPGGVINPVISIYDLKSGFKGNPLTLSESSMQGSAKISGVVTSDHSGNNLPEGLLIIQDIGRYNNRRSMVVNLGAAAANYVPGDSVDITLTGGTLERVNGILQVTGLNASAVTKLASGSNVYTTIINDVNDIAKNPDVYENALVTITQAEVNPPASEGDTFSGDVAINNGSGDYPVHTNTGADYASKSLPFLATYIGILFSENDVFKIWPRSEKDIIVLSANPPVIAPIIITGFLNNSIGTDANFEYIQLMATRDIDFSVTNMSVVTSNNAGSLGAPAKSWAEGAARTYKFDLTSGTVTKGSYFYVGGRKLLNGENSTDISSANWIVSKDYAQIAGDGFGTRTSNLLANSGNPAGIAVFTTTEVDANTIPVDVIFFGQTSNNNVFEAGPPPVGYRITNTDYYETENTTVPTLDPQPFFRMGTNVFKFVTVNDEKYRQLGGTYNTRNGKWPTKRTMTELVVPADGTLSMIEGATSLTDER